MRTKASFPPQIVGSFGFLPILNGMRPGSGAHSQNRSPDGEGYDGSGRRYYGGGGLTLSSCDSHLFWSSEEATGSRPAVHAVKTAALGQRCVFDTAVPQTSPYYIPRIRLYFERS